MLEKELELDLENAKKEKRFQAEKYSVEYFKQMNGLANRVVSTFERERFIKDKDIVLDIGCGMGRMLTRISQRWQKCLIVGVDLSLTDALFAKRRAYDLQMPAAERIVVIVADARALPFKDNSFNFVFSHSTLEHIVEPEQTARETMRVLKQHHPLYVTISNALRVDKWSDFGKPSFYSILTPYEFKKFFTPYEKTFMTLSGFKEKSKSYMGSILRTVAEKTYFAGYFTPELALKVVKTQKKFFISLQFFTDSTMDIFSLMFLPLLFFQRKKIKKV